MNHFILRLQAHMFSVSTNKDDAHRKWQNDEVQIIVATVCLEFLPSFTVRILIGV